MVDDEDIVIEVWRNPMNSKQYVVSAYYKSKEKIRGYSYADENIWFFRSLGIGTSLEDSLKQATCEAIKNLKNEYNEYTKKREFLQCLNDKANSYVKMCKSGDVVE